MRTLLFVDTTHSGVGGVGSRQVRLAEELPGRGWRPLFALTRGARFHDPDRYRSVLPPFESIELDGRTGSSDGRRIAIRDLIRKVQPSVVLPNAILDAWAVCEELKRLGKGPRIVYGLPGVFVNSVHFVAKHAAVIDGAFGVSPLTRQLLVDYCGIPAERTLLVPTGIRLPAGQPSAEIHAPIRLVYVGRLDRDKRALDLAALVEELARRGTDFHLSVIGSGEYLPELQAVMQVDPRRVSVRGAMTAQDLYDEVYPAADAILLFSDREGVPNALLEGMAHGVVPITSDFHGRENHGLFRENETALVFPRGDIGSAADRIELLIRTPGMKVTMGKNARRIVKDAASTGRMADAFLALLEKATEGPPRQGPVPPLPLEGRSRLRRVLGPRGAEAVRRALGYRFMHPDASEWPLIDNVEPLDREVEETSLRCHIARIEESIAARSERLA